MKIITKTIWILSLVSLFTDVASEMLYPIIPIYLKSINFSIVLIGILEGFAEAMAGVSKGYFGNRSDDLGKRLPFVRWGYALSAISKPMMAAFTLPLWVFAARTTDRLGKGIRTAARDAMLSDESTLETKGTVFGFHRSMDTVGAVVGPILALIFLYFYTEEYKTLFYIAFIPGLFAIGFTFLLKERKVNVNKPTARTDFFAFLKYWKQSPSAYRKLVIGLLLFSLFNSADIFLLLRIKEAGNSDVLVVGTYIFYNLIYAILAYPLGILADNIGLKNIFILGLVCFAVVYVGFAFNNNNFVFFSLFFLYGIYAAATEGIAKAWITNISGRNSTATAIGTFTAFQSICTLFASSITGLMWFVFGSAVTFASIAIMTVIVIGYFLLLNKSQKNLPEIT